MSTKQQQIRVLKSLILEHDACIARLLAGGVDENHPNITHLNNMIQGCKTNLRFVESPDEAKVAYGYVAPVFSKKDLLFAIGEVVTMPSPWPRTAKGEIVSFDGNVAVIKRLDTPFPFHSYASTSELVERNR